MVPPSQPAQVAPTSLAEEKHFALNLDQSAHVIKTAIEDAIGVELTELAHGMWFARGEPKDGTYRDITVRALPTDDGTSVEVRIEHSQTPLATAWYITVVLAGVMLILPLFYMIAKGQQRQQELSRTRLVEMHKIWTELTSAVGAPTTAGYRERQKQVRMRVEEKREVADAEAEEAEISGETDAPPPKALR